MDRQIQGTPLAGERELSEQLRDVRQRLSSPGNDATREYNISSPMTPPAARTAPAGSSQGVTLEAIASLLDKKFDEKLCPMSDMMHELKGEVNELKDTVEANDKMITANVENLTGDLVRFQTSCEAKIKELEDKLQQGTRTPNSSSNEDVLQKLKEIENEIERLRLGKDEQSNEDQCSTAVVGGLAQKGSTEAAMTWLTDALWNHWAPRPVDHYIKQEEFSGMLFLKF